MNGLQESARWRLVLLRGPGLARGCGGGNFADPEHILDLFGLQVFGPAEYVRLAAAVTAELVYLNHLAERDEADECVGGQEA